MGQGRGGGPGTRRGLGLQETQSIWAPNLPPPKQLCSMGSFAKHLPCARHCIRRCGSLVHKAAAVPVVRELPV
uniref:Uncharacterized protein n=1 Tax=Sus scrofa TaxID=9823 RepID=A0A4X1U8W1_PIG